LSKVISRGKAKSLEKDKIPAPLSFEEAELAWRMQVQSAFAKAGMDKYVREEIVEGGTIRPAVRDEGGLCDFPSCGKEYEYALKLDRFANTETSGYAGPVREGFVGTAGVGGHAVFAPSPDTVRGPSLIFVCGDHKDWRPDTLPSQRFVENYTWKHEALETRQVSRIPNIKVEDD
jgi:hypothetical protein